MWECIQCGAVTEDQVVPPCKHVFCGPCYKNLQNTKWVLPISLASFSVSFSNLFSLKLTYGFFMWMVVRDKVNWASWPWKTILILTQSWTNCSMSFPLQMPKMQSTIFWWFPYRPNRSTVSSDYQLLIRIHSFTNLFEKPLRVYFLKF